MSAHHSFFDDLKVRLEARTSAGLGRKMLNVSARHGKHIVIDGQTYLNFSSNDFLGLAQEPAAADTLARLCARHGVGSGASRLVTGTSSSTLEAENSLARHFGHESCLILGSGFLANLTLIATLFSDKDTLILDKRAHTSTMAGVLHSGARFHTFRHNSISHLSKLLQDASPQAVLTESLFSMDGDTPDLAAIENLKKDFEFLCIVDEAHAFGVLGDKGRGLGRSAADVAVGTLGKAFGLFGAFVLMPETVRDYLVHFGQGFIYTTALPPWHGDMVQTMLELSAHADDRRQHLHGLGLYARELLRDAGIAVRGEHHILAVEVRDEGTSMRLADALRGEGLLVFAARYPTVPLGQAILRVCLTSDHVAADVVRLRDALLRALAAEGA